MPFEILRNDITNMSVDAIVNTANPAPMVGAGTDAMIHEKAGPQLLEARKCIGHIEVGHAAITPAYNLDAKYVIHTVGPMWLGGGQNEETQLRGCYDNALRLAVQHGCTSVAFPLISTGNYGFPKDKALQIAIAAFSEFLLEQELQIYLVVFHREAYRLSEKLFCHVESFVDQHYVDACEEAAYDRMAQRRAVRNCCEKRTEQWPSMAPEQAQTLADALKSTDMGFSEALLKLIDKTGKKDSEIYKKANISKQHFSKIRKNPAYQPTKATAIALALALELNLEDTQKLIGRAGYALTNSSKFDLIIQFFIQQKNYNVVEINIALYEFDQPLLGA